ncbi:hypothetical protein MALU111345_05360 [Marinicrinis lubricantis]
MSLPSIARLQFDVTEMVDSTTEQVVHKTYAWDDEAGDFLKKDGKLIVLTGLEYIKTWCNKALRTVRGSLIY